MRSSGKRSLVTPSMFIRKLEEDQVGAEEPKGGGVLNSVEKLGKPFRRGSKDGAGRPARLWRDASRAWTRARRCRRPDPNGSGTCGTRC